MEKLTENNIRVILHRLRKEEVPNINRLKKIKPYISKKDLKIFVDSAKTEYQKLLEQ